MLSGLPKTTKRALFATVALGGLIACFVDSSRNPPQTMATPQAPSPSLSTPTASPTPTPDPANSDIKKAEAEVMAQDFVKDRLKSPSSARFPQMFDSDPAQVIYKDGTYLVKSHVDSQNAFGAMMRTDYICKLKNTGDRWKLVDIAIKQRE